MCAQVATKNSSRRKFLARGGAMFGALGSELGNPLAGAAAAEAYTLRLGLPNPAASVHGRVGLRFAVAVARRSNGQVKIEVYPNGQLAKQQETIDALSTGSLDFAILGASFLEAPFPQFRVLAMPFLFRDVATVFRIMDGPLGAKIAVELEPRGIIGLGFAGLFHELFTLNRPVVVPEDMKGLRVRIPGGAVSAATFQALGAIPVTIDLAELFVAATQHTIDAISTSVDSFVSEKYYAVFKHMVMLNDTFAIQLIMGSKRKIEALPPALQKIVREEAKAVVPYYRDLYSEETANEIALVKKSGVAITEVQFSAFRKAVDPVYVAYKAKLGGDLLDQVGRAANAT
jgi:TRAP-type transport system periplasmic protein